MVSPLEARDLHYEYGGPVVALRGVDLALREGEVCGVVGPNGSGKSTLVRCLAGLLRPARGAVTVGGERLESLAARERARRIAVVPQYLPALPDLGVLDFVVGGRYAHWRRLAGPGPRDVEVARGALEACDAADVLARRIDELSGGQRQRALVARAIAQEARILLVDEPSSSLDPEHQVKVFALIARLAREGRAVLIVTHDLTLAGQFADRLVLLDDGRVVVDGPVGEVLRRDVLAPVYGPHLRFGSLPGPDGRARPYAIPWLGAPEEGGDDGGAPR